MNNIRLESDKRLKKVIQSIHLKHKEYGYPRMKIALEEEGYFINHKKVYRLMSELCLVQNKSGSYELLGIPYNLEVY
ncbi:IS3 family transposase [Bacillus thuringiensis]|uniref:IS3 family transposase n=1 Tax=Bacillus thuringiensis TaxID=1428 RepID=UPI0011554F07|nr:IS3 family transposase [Bacillus thuringiensis]